MDDGRPIFIQVAESIEDSIVDGSLLPGEQAPSTNALASFHRINPATAAKGLGVLVASGVLEKRRGLGMFVTQDARQLLVRARTAAFAERFVAPLLLEARKLGLDTDELVELLRTQQPAGHTEGSPR